MAEMQACEQLLQGAGAAPAWRGASSTATLADGTLHLLLNKDEFEMPNSAIYTAFPQAGRVLGNDVNSVSLL